jgi:hypothetical protein
MSCVITSAARRVAFNEQKFGMNFSTMNNSRDATRRPLLLRLRMTETQVLLRAFESALARKWKRTVVSKYYLRSMKLALKFMDVISSTLYLT